MLLGLSVHVFTNPYAKVRKVDKINKSVYSCEMVTTFVFSVLENHCEHPTHGSDKRKKIDKINVIDEPINGLWWVLT